MQKEGRDYCTSSGWWETHVPERQPPQTRRQRALEPSAEDTAHRHPPRLPPRPRPTKHARRLRILPFQLLQTPGSSGACGSFLDAGSPQRKLRGARFAHVKPEIRGGGRQARQGHWWALGWRRGMGWTPAGDKGWRRAPGWEGGVQWAVGKGNSVRNQARH